MVIDNANKSMQTCLTVIDIFLDITDTFGTMALKGKFKLYLVASLQYP